MSSSSVQSELMETYLSWTEQTLGEMRGLVAAAQDKAEQAQLDAIYDIAHNIKGMGASFGFPLMSRAGASLCVYLRRLEGALPDWVVVDAHVRSFEVIIGNRIEGDGGDMGAKLIDRLAKLVDRAQRAA